MPQIITDPVLLSALAKQGIDKDYVEFWHDYAPRSKGKEYSPYAKFYRDLKSGKRIIVVSGLPMVKPLGHKIEVGWLAAKGKFYSKANLFSAIVDGKQVQLTCLSEQPDGTKKDEQVTWRPRLFLDGSEILNGEQATLLPIDPLNENYKENTLEWAYGNVCKRRIRIIEGRFRERWLFESNPHSRVRIKHNFVGSLKLMLGYANDAEDNPLEVTVVGDEEIVEASEFDRAVYPVEIGAEDTFYPDADPETSSVDGKVEHSEAGLTWAGLVAATGTGANPSAAACTVNKIYSGTITDKWETLRRGVFLFDTSALPDACVITSAVLSIYGRGKVDEGSWTPNVNIYSSDPASNTDLVAGDFDSLGSVAYATAITYAAWSTSGYNDFTLNASGKGAISKTGVSKFGTRDAKYDVSGTPPSPWASDDISYLQNYYAEQGAGYKPKLVVTYSIGITPFRSLDPKPRTRTKFYPSLKLG